MEGKVNLRHPYFFIFVFIGIAATLTSCAPKSSEGDSRASGSGNNYGLMAGPTSILQGSRKFTTDALVFNGTGTWSPEPSSLESILSSHGATYREVSSAELNEMSVDDLSQFGAIVWPGGIALKQANSLSATTKDNLRRAVQERGVSWIGFCAGAFIAAAPAEHNASYTIGIVDTPLLDMYYLEQQLERAGKTDISMTMESFPDGSKRDLVWYGGPITPSGHNMVIAKYPTGDAAISQMWSGNGFLILSGVHPGAPQSTRRYFSLVDSDGTDFDLAWTLLEAAINQKALPTFN
ncbi:MAG: hypothetical protein HY074_10405 [Deltaproteobacteria bacterium]|nr:hypothetical protein [Deltaproteobacteria bacterium]